MSAHGFSILNLNNDCALDKMVEVKVSGKDGKESVRIKPCKHSTQAQAVHGGRVCSRTRRRAASAPVSAADDKAGGAGAASGLRAMPEERRERHCVVVKDLKSHFIYRLSGN